MVVFKKKEMWEEKVLVHHSALRVLTGYAQ